MAIQHIKTPVDLVSLACISKADVQQAIDTAYPYPDQGFIIWSATAPDVVANPEMANFLWGQTIAGLRTSNIYYYNGTSWELIPLTILDGSITLSKIDLTGSTPYYIIQVNSAGNALIWTSIISAIQSNTIPPIKLLVPNNTDTFILSSFAGTKAFVELVAFFAAIADNVIPVTKLIKGAANTLKQFLSTKADGSAVEWAAIDLANVGAAALSAGQVARRNVGNTAWEPYTPPVSSVPTFIAPVTVYSSGVAAWTTYSTSSALLTGKLAAILECSLIFDSGTSGTNVIANIRKDSGDAARLLTLGAGTDAFQVGSQAIMPVTADGKFDYQIVLSGDAGNLAATIKLIGYIG